MSTPPVKTPQELADMPVHIISDEAFDKLTELLKEDGGKPNQKLIDLMRRPKRWAEKKPQPHKKLQLTIELLGTGKELIVGKASAFPETGGGPALYLNKLGGRDWSLLYTPSIISDIHKLERIEIIRREEPLYRGLRFVGLDQELELDIVAAMTLSQGVFNLDQLSSGKWRLGYDTNTFPDLSQVEAMVFTIHP